MKDQDLRQFTTPALKITIGFMTIRQTLVHLRPNLCSATLFFGNTVAPYWSMAKTFWGHVSTASLKYSLSLVMFEQTVMATFCARPMYFFGTGGTIY